MDKKEGGHGSKPPPAVHNETSNISLQLQSLLNVPSTKVSSGEGDLQQRNCRVNEGGFNRPRNCGGVGGAAAGPAPVNEVRGVRRIDEGYQRRPERIGDQGGLVNRTAERGNDGVFRTTGDLGNDGPPRRVVVDRFADRENAGPYRRNEKVVEDLVGRVDNVITERTRDEGNFGRMDPMSGYENPNRRMDSNRDNDRNRRIDRTSDFARPLENLSNHTFDRNPRVMERTGGTSGGYAGRFSGEVRDNSLLGPRRMGDQLNFRKPEVEMIIRLIGSKGCPRSLQNCINVLIEDAVRIEDSASPKVNFSMLSNDTRGILNYHFIDILLRRSPKFIRAKYYCTLCSYHTDTVYATLEHICNERHLTLEKAKRATDKIHLLPKPSLGHLQAVKTVMDHMCVENRMTKEEKDRRVQVFNEFQQIVFRVCGADFPRLSLYGTSFTGLGFADANLNLNLEVPEPDSSSPEISKQSNGSLAGPEYVSHLITSLENNKIITNVKEQYSGKKAFASFDFEYQSIVYACVLTLNNRTATNVTELFDEYHKLESRLGPLTIGLRTLAKEMAIDDQENGYLPSHCFTIMAIHYMQAINAIPVLNELPHVALTRIFATANEALYGGWNTTNNSHIGKLWIDMLRYYAFEFDYKTTVISISRSNVRKKDEKCWNRWICIEDPILQNANLTRSMTNKTCDFVVDRLRAAYIYFAIPRCKEGTLYDAVNPERFSNRPDTFTRIIHVIEDGSQYPVLILDGPNAENYKPNGVCRSIRLDMIRRCDDYDGSSEIKVALQTDGFQKVGNFLPIPSYDYKFEHLRNLPGQNPPLACKSCGSDSHVKKNCPDEILPQVLPMEWPSVDVMQKISHALCMNFESEVILESDVALRKIIASELLEILRTNIPMVKLSLFGSTMNGFGLKKSDLDLCLTFLNDKGQEELTQQGSDATTTLKKIVSALKASGMFADIVAIASAKVPIVKFRHKHYGIDGDISLYNILARENTCLLQAYCQIDKRVQVLGLFLKKFVKICDISDASKGSLSSYGYILMLIHFLQQASPPVLPVLQQFQRPAQLQRTFPDTYFFKDAHRVKQEWDHVENTNHVVVLWLQFLQYYVEKFDFDKYVVSIRHTEPLTRKQKGWMTESIAIEDPFDTTHNLGAGLSSRMSNHIRKAFIRAREHFFRPPPIGLLINNYLDYYMYDSELRGSDPPIDRQCRICRKIGHFARRCPSMGRGGNDLDSDDSSDRATGNEGSPEKNTIREESSKISDSVTLLTNHLNTQRPEQIEASIFSPLIALSNDETSKSKEVVISHGHHKTRSPPPTLSKSEDLFGANRARIIELTGQAPEDVLIAASKYRTGCFSAQQIEEPESIPFSSDNNFATSTTHKDLAYQESDLLHTRIDALTFQDMIRKSKGVSFASHLTNMVKEVEVHYGRDTDEEPTMRAPLTYADAESPLHNNFGMAMPRAVIPHNMIESNSYPQQFARPMHEAAYAHPQNAYPNMQNNNDSMFGTFPVHALSAPPPGFTQLSTPMRPVFNYCGPVMSSSVGGEIRGNLAHQANRGLENRLPDNLGVREQQYRIPNLPMGASFQMSADSQMLMDAYAKKSGLPMPLPQPNSAPMMYGMQPEFQQQVMFTHFIPNNSAATSQGQFVPQQNMAQMSPPQTSFAPISQTTSYSQMYNHIVPMSPYEPVATSFAPPSSYAADSVASAYSTSSDYGAVNGGTVVSNSLAFMHYPPPNSVVRPVKLNNFNQ